MSAEFPLFWPKFDWEAFAATRCILKNHPPSKYEAVIELSNDFTQLALGDIGFQHTASSGERDAVFVKARGRFSQIHHRRITHGNLFFSCVSFRLFEAHTGPAAVLVDELDTSNL